MPDPFQNHAPGLESPASGVLPVIPDDGADLPVTARALNVAQSGFVQITTLEGQTASVYVAAGIAFPVRTRRVWLTGTTATGIAALY